MKKLFEHVVAQDSSGSNATNTFLSGKGDVLLTFESEAINARLAGRNIQYVIPRQTMLIDIYAARDEREPEQGHGERVPPVPEVASPSSVVLAQNGYRPGEQEGGSRSSRSSSRSRPGEITINDKMIGGWAAADKKWFDPNNSIMATIEKNAGSVDHWHLRTSLRLRASGRSGRAST